MNQRMISWMTALCALAALVGTVHGFTYQQSFETGLEGWSGDGEYHSSTGGLNNTGYKGGQRSGSGPYHAPAQPPAADALLGNMQTRFGPGVRFSFWLKVIGGTQTGSPQFYLFSGGNTWGLDLGIHDFSQWTHILFELDTTWSDTEARAAGWYNDPWNGGSFSDAWTNVTYYNFFSTAGAGTVDTGIDEVLIESESPWDPCTQNFDAGIGGWLGGQNGNPTWIPTGGLDDTPYHQASGSGTYPAHEPWDDPDRSAFAAGLLARLGPVVEFSCYLKDFSAQNPGASPVVQAFLNTDSGTRWERQIAPVFPVNWTRVSFVLDLTWADAAAVAEGWRRTSGGGSWVSLFAVDGVPASNAGLRCLFGLGSGSYGGTRITGIDCATVQTGKILSPVGRYCLPFTVTSPLPFPLVPLDPTISFEQIIADNAIAGVLDQSSITVRDSASRLTVPSTVERFGNDDTLRIEWVLEDPSHTEYDICFNTNNERSPLRPATSTPMIGVGDLLHYNAGVPRPVAPIYISGLHDVTGDGMPDLIGVWNYAHRPGDRWDGVVVWPRTAGLEELEFGDMLRVYEVPDIRYCTADMGDLNHDGIPDIVFSPSNSSQMTVYASTGARHATLLPAYTSSSTSISRPSGSGWTVRVVDLDADGVQDVVAAGGFPSAESGAASSTAFLRNTNAQGWPLSMQNQGNLSLAGYEPDFLYLDGDTRPDAVVLVTDPADPGLSGYTVAWQRNLGGTPPQFGPAQPLAEVNAQIFRPVGVAAVNEGPERGLLVEHHNWQRVAFFRSPAAPTESSRLEYVGEAGSVAAPMSLSDQAWPYPCDWDGDGDWDLLVGGGYGWPQIVINEGTNAQPAFAKSQLIYADSQPIRLLRNLILGQPFHWHNMGYPYPVYADWDMDGLPDLVIPNETNRIFWYRNVGTRQNPRFGPQEQILVDGYPDSPALRQLSAERALSATYPKEQEQPFFWRTGAAVADFNGDGLTDLATHDGYTRNLTLFARYRGGNNELRLRKEGPLTVTDGRPINESIVGRSSGWTESFDAIDWNGDGLMDVVYSLSGKSGDTVYLLRNVGTMPSPVFALPEPIRPFGQPINITAHGPHVGVADLDGDGRPEVIGCTEWSVYAFYRGTALAMAQRPGYQLGSVYSPTAGADFDFDEDVDQDDFGLFQLCLTGPYLGPPVAGCEGTDLDGDGDVDAEDASVFLQCLSGANVPADPHCTD